jgi:hypothetical protein
MPAAAGIITNGSLLSAERLGRLRGQLDWLGLSIDASSAAMHARVGFRVQGFRVLGF